MTGETFDLREGCRRALALEDFQKKRLVADLKKAMVPWRA